MAKKLKEREVECETCKKKILRKNGIGLILENKISDFFCCSHQCLLEYVTELCEHEEFAVDNDSVGDKNAK